MAWWKIDKTWLLKGIAVTIILCLAINIAHQDWGD